MIATNAPFPPSPPEKCRLGNHSQTCLFPLPLFHSVEQQILVPRKGISELIRDVKYRGPTDAYHQ